MLGVASPSAFSFGPQRVEVRLHDVGEDQVLLVRDADLAEAVAIGEGRDRVHLARRDVAGRRSGALERERDDRVAAAACARGRCARPSARTDGCRRRPRGGRRCRARTRGRADRTKCAARRAISSPRHRARTVAELLPLGLHLPRELGRRQLLHQDLDPRLVDVVATTVPVVDAEDRIEVVEQLRRRQELADHVTDHRRASLAAPHDDAEARAARLIAYRLHADVVDEDSGAVVRRSADGDLELARQEREFRIQRRPLADQLRPRTRIDDLVAGDAGERIARDVAHAIARRLDRVHLDLGELGQDLRHVLELRPVELQVLARREVTVAAVVAAGDVREGSQLGRREHAVRNGNPQHRCVLLDVQAVLKTQRPELVLGQLARQEPSRLIAELSDPAGDQRAVKIVVAVHGVSLMIETAEYRRDAIIGKNIKS